MEQATRDYAASHADIPAHPGRRSRSCSPSSDASTRRGALWPGSTTPRLDRLHDRNWPASWFQLARAASIVGDRDLATTLLEADAPSDRAVREGLARHGVPRRDRPRERPGCSTPSATSMPPMRATDRRRSSTPASARAAGSRRPEPTTPALLLERDGAGDRDDGRAPDRPRCGTPPRASARSLAMARPRRHDPSARSARAGRRSGGTGAVWELDFAGRTAQLPDARGLRDLAFLLARPGEAVSVLELADDAGVAPATARARRRSTSGRAARSATGCTSSTRRGRRRSDGDGERAALAREQRQALAEAVARDFGLGGRARLIGDPVERARKTVSTRIRRAIAIDRASPSRTGPPPRTIDRHRHLVRLPARRAGRLADLTRRDATSRCRAISL